MNIFIHNTSGEPIYSQICSQIKTAIINGELKDGESLPSIRVLAKELRVSVITTKRAYEELELDGLIVSVPGKGSFVTIKNMDFVKEEQLRNIENHMKEIVKSANISGITAGELCIMLTLIYEEETQ